MLSQQEGCCLGNLVAGACALGGRGQGLRFAMDEPFNFNAYHYSTDNLTKAVYTYQLRKQDGITLNLDYNTTGVGCTACYVLPGYQVKPARYERHLTIKPIAQ